MRRKDLRLYNERIENLDRNWAVESIDEILIFHAFIVEYFNCI
jgi:hypothetical protein